MTTITPRIHPGLPTLLEGSASDLLTALEQLHELLGGLAACADDKLAAIRAADSAALQACTLRETALLEEVVSAEKARNAALAGLAQALRAPEVRASSLASVAEKLPEPFSSRIRAKGLGLRQRAEILQKKNRLAGQVARHLQLHLRSVMTELTNGGQPPVVYGPAGRMAQSTTRAWLDAVG